MVKNSFTNFYIEVVANSFITSEVSPSLVFYTVTLLWSFPSLLKKEEKHKRPVNISCTGDT